VSDVRRIESTLLRYPGVAVARVAETADGELIARVLPWGRPPGEPDTGALAEVAGLNSPETRFLHDEIFVAEIYLQGGVVLRQDAVIFDVGANIGLFTMFAAARCPSACVYSFEPVPDVFSVLRHNTEVRGIGAHLFEVGLSDRDQEMTFNYYPEISLMSCRSEYANFANERDLLSRYVQHQRKTGPPGRESHLAAVEALLERDFEYRARRVRLRRTSGLIEETKVRRIDLLKIDVQRAELDVLRGIDSGHWRLINQVSMEVHDEAGYPTEGRLGTVLSLLRSQGFRVTYTESELLSGIGRFAVHAIRPDYAEDPRPVVACAGNGRPPVADQLRAWLIDLLPRELVPDKVLVVSSLN